MPYRHPAVLANMAATLDVVSGGRLELGIGAGWNQEEADAYGIDLGSSLTERFDRFDEACEIIVGPAQPADDHRRRRALPGDRRLLRAEAGPAAAPADLHRWHRARSARCRPWPGGPSTGTTRAPSVADWQATRDVLHACCAEVGRDPAEITTSTHLRFSPDDGPGALAESAAEWAEAGLDLGIIYLPTPHTPAVLEPLAEALRPLA